MTVLDNGMFFGGMCLGGDGNNPLITSEDYKNEHKIIDTALEAGFRSFDFANIYKSGKSEKVFGDYLKHNPNIRDDIFIQSKVGIVPPKNDAIHQFNFSYEHIISEVENSLKRLNISSLDSLLLHRPDPLLDGKELKKAVDHLYKHNLIKNFGVSNMHLHQIQLLEHYIERPIFANQLELNLLKLDWINSGTFFNTEKSSNINFTPGTIEYCMKNNISLQAWSPLAKGILSGRELPDNTPENIIKTCEYIKLLSEEKNVSRECIVLGWLMRHPAHVKPVVGTKNIERISSMKHIDKVSLSRDEWYNLYNLSRGYNLP